MKKSNEKTEQKKADENVYMVTQARATYAAKRLDLMRLTVHERNEFVSIINQMLGEPT